MLQEAESKTVAEALTRHYRAHGLPDDGGAQDDWFRVRIGPAVLPLPNPRARKRAVLFHDVNHLLTGYNTVFSDGEMAIAGYELASGCGRFAVAWVINLWMFALGLIACPRRLYHAFLRGRHARSVYRWENGASLRAMTVGDLRTALGVPAGAPGARPRDIGLFVAWSLLAWTATLGPLVGVLALWWVLG